MWGVNSGFGVKSPFFMQLLKLHGINISGHQAWLETPPLSMSPIPSNPRSLASEAPEAPEAPAKPGPRCEASAGPGRLRGSGKSARTARCDGDAQFHPPRTYPWHMGFQPKGSKGWFIVGFTTLNWKNQEELRSFTFLRFKL